MAKDVDESFSVLLKKAEATSAIIAERSRYTCSKLKRVFDIVICLMVLPVALPLIALLALAVFFVDFRNPFFKHARIGKNGNMFNCLKIRTMHPQADEMLRELLTDAPELNQQWQQSYRLSADPRVTVLGLWMRRVCLDELPQIFNVLKGDMSLVGPRPVTSEELPLYGDMLPVYLAIRPGLTGYWQIRERHSDGNFADRRKHDLEYYQTASLRGDLQTLIATPVKAVAGESS